MKRRLLALTMALLMLVSLVPMQAMADDTQETRTVTLGNIVCTLEGSTLTFSGEGECDDAWMDCFTKTSITEVVIMKGITSIGDHAFLDCTALESVTLPDGVTEIGGWAFWGCTALENVILSEDLTKIDRHAFRDCTSLKSLTLPDSLAEIWENAFLDCTAFESVTLPDDLTYIGYSAFEGCTALESAILPGSLGKLGSNAFKGCTALENVTMYDGLTEIGSGAFFNCTALENIALPESVTEIGGGAFSGCSALKSVNIPANVTEISGSAFSRCSALESIDIPDEVTKIGSYAFSGCTALSGITLPDGLTEIGSSAFDNTPYYNDPANWDGDVLYIDKYLVDVNTEIEGTCTVKDGTVLLADNAFCDCTALTSITLPDSLTCISDTAFYYCTALESITLPETLTRIGDDAFFGCSVLANLTLPDSLTHINYQAFCYCDALESITIPGSVTSIGYSAFYGCDALADISLPDGLTYIGNDAFANTAYYNDEANWDDSALYIGKYLIEVESDIEGDYVIKDDTLLLASEAFYNCSALESIKLPYSVTSICDFAFYGCTALTDVYYGGTQAQWNQITIGYCNDALQSATIHFTDAPDPAENSVTDDNGITYTLIDGTLTVSGEGECNYYAWRDTFNKDSITKLVIEDGITCIGNNVFSYCTALSSITIPDSVTIISGFAFYGCTALESVTIPDSVTEIGGYAFQSCTALKDVTLPDSAASIGNGAFCDCTALESITIHDGLTEIGLDAFSNTAYYNDEANWEDGVLYIGKYLLDAKDDIEGDYTIKDGTVMLAFAAFDDCTELKSITIPAGVTTICSYAFDGCTALTDVYYGGTEVQWEQITIFSGNDALQNATIHFTDAPDPAENSVTIDGITYTLEDGTLTVSGEGVCARAWNRYFEKTSVTTLIVKEGITEIGDFAFWNCTALENVTLPDSLKYIRYSAFDSCTALNSITLPDSLKYIEEYAFSRCNALTDIYYGGTMIQWVNIQIDDYNKPLLGATLHAVRATEGTITVDDITYTLEDGTMTVSGEGNCTCEWTTYFEQSAVKALVVEEGVTGICDYVMFGYGAFYDCTELESISLPDSLTEIGLDAFYNTAYYNDPDNWEDGLLYIGKYLVDAKDDLSGCTVKDGTVLLANFIFADCTALESVTLPESVKNIGYAFCGCASIKSITIPASIGNVGFNSFANCISLESVTISDGISSVNAAAFYGCTALETVTIPTSVKTIQSSAFYGCTSLSDVYYEGTKEQWKQINIGDNNDALLSATIHFTDDYPFTDVDADGAHAPFAEAILWAAENNITSGYGNGVFAPEDPCSRGQVVTFIWRSAGCPEPKSMKNPFTDVPESSPFYKAILWAVEEGITSGYGNGIFGLNDTCTRAQVVTFLWRYAGRPTANASSNRFSDTQNLNSDYKAAIAWATENGITAGYSDGTFAPAAVCKRTHVVTFLWRYETNK